MNKLSLDTKLLLGTFTGTFALVLALGLPAPAGGSAAGAGDGQHADSPSAPVAAVGETARVAGTDLGARAAPAQVTQSLPAPLPVEPTPPEVIEADRWAVAEPPNNNY